MSKDSEPSLEVQSSTTPTPTPTPDTASKPTHPTKMVAIEVPTQLTEEDVKIIYSLGISLMRVQDYVRSPGVVVLFPSVTGEKENPQLMVGVAQYRVKSASDVQAILDHASKIDHRTQNANALVIPNGSATNGIAPVYDRKKRRDRK